MSETTSVTRRLARQILRLPSWVRIPLLAAFVVGLLTGVRILFALPGGGSHGRRDIGLALPVLAKAVVAAAGGGLVYTLCRDPLARLGRFGSILSGAVLVFTYLVGCAVAFEVKHIDGIAIGVAIGISLVGGAILKPARLNVISSTSDTARWLASVGNICRKTARARLEASSRPSNLRASVNQRS